MIERAEYCVLVVDDHEPSRYATARALRAAGFRTIEAAAGAEALELAEYASAVVLDVHLPDLLGFEVCRLLRANIGTASLPIVQVSAIYVTEQDKLTAREAGADAYMTAPVDLDALVGTLDQLLARPGGARG